MDTQIEGNRIKPGGLVWTDNPSNFPEKIRGIEILIKPPLTMEMLAFYLSENVTIDYALRVDNGTEVWCLSIKNNGK